MENYDVINTFNLLWIIDIAHHQKEKYAMRWRKKLPEIIQANIKIWQG